MMKGKRKEEWKRKKKGEKRGGKREKIDTGNSYVTERPTCRREQSVEPPTTPQQWNRRLAIQRRRRKALEANAIRLAVSKANCILRWGIAFGRSQEAKQRNNCAVHKIGLHYESYISAGQEETNHVRLSRGCPAQARSRCYMSRPMLRNTVQPARA